MNTLLILIGIVLVYYSNNRQGDQERVYEEDKHDRWDTLEERSVEKDDKLIQIDINRRLKDVYRG